jgi:hydroxyacylglutathione hydrolase
MLKIDFVIQGNNNVVWLVWDDETRDCVIVDSLDSESSIKEIENRDVVFRGILNTHHHGDHTAANLSLIRRFGKQIIVAGSKSDYGRKLIPGQNLALDEDGAFEAGSLNFTVKTLPGHTHGHIGYKIQKHFFCGDSLFLSGCGRVFEGTPDEMYSTLQKIASLDKDVKLYPGHEYSLNNIRFIRYHNLIDGISAREKEVRQSIEQCGCSLPTTVAQEAQWNPFIKVQDPQYRESVEMIASPKVNSAVMAFMVLREMKDLF